jgi:hypothetical protein
MDDGGMGYKRTIPWLDEGLRRLKAVKNQEVSLCDWAREGWGAEINSFQVKIYSLNDEDFFEIINILDFEKILKFWKNFIEAEPILGQEEALDIES